MKLVDLSVKRPVGLIMIVLAIIALGFVSLKNLAVDLYPEIDLPIAVVATSYPGAGPEEVEKRLSKPIEDAVSTIEGIDTIQSQSQPNSSLVIMQFATGTNLDNALLEVREKIDGVKAMLPDDANDPSVLRFDPQQIPVMFIGLTGDKPEKLQEIAENEIQPYFERSEGVASVSVDGGKTREIHVELNQGMMAAYNLTPNQIIQAMASNNLSASAGVLEKGGKDIQIRIDGEYSSLEDIKNTIITLASGETIKLSEVSTVKDTFKEVNTVSLVNNEPSLVLSVLKQSDANTINVADGMYETMEEINETLPKGYKLSILFDTSTFIRDSINSVVSNMVTGGILAIFILMLFLRSVRATIVIGLSIPIAIISTFTLMYFTGQTVNILSMGGLALGIGMMVDNSIVILENIFDYRQKGASIKEAAIKGGSELASAVIASTTTSLVVFIPIVYVQGIASDLFTPLALTVSFSLIASLAVALTMIPMLSSKFLQKPIKSMDPSRGLFNRFFAKINRFYQRLLKFVLGHRKTTVLVTIVALVASFALAPMIGASFIPASDQGQLTISVETETGSSLAFTESITDQVNEKLQPYKDMIEVNYLSIGSDVQTGLSSGTNIASFQIQLIDAKERDITTSEFAEQIKADVGNIPGAEIVVSEMEAGLGTGAPIQINVNGPEQEVLQEVAEQVKWLVEGVDGVVNPETSASDGRPELRVVVDRSVASQYGLTYQQIMSQVELAFNGKRATLFREDGDEFDVRIMLPEDERTKISDLEQLSIQTPAGTYVPLTVVAELKQLQGPAQINRQNQQRQVNVTANIEGRDLNSVTQDIKAALAKMNFPEGYSYSVGGQSEDMAESFQNLAIGLVFSIFLVYAVMAVQFESFVYPFVIMFSMPTMLVGILTGLFITGQPFSIPAFIGIIMLAGIVVNNAIVLVDYINILRNRGIDRMEAILQAGPSRLRPILMTTLTTVLGMLPLSLGLGQGGEAQVPLAVVIIFGLSTSTLFTLLLIPVMYTYMDDFSNFTKRLFGGKVKFRLPKGKKKEQTEGM